MRIDQSHFTLFGLPEQFELDTAVLDVAYRKVQREVHPDRFVSATDAEKRVALQWSARANEAYETLRTALSRAVYLCNLRGVNPTDETNTVMQQEFLVEQIEWRETLDELRGDNSRAADEKLSGLETEVRMRFDDGIASLGKDFADASDRAALLRASNTIRRLLFLERFQHDLGHARIALDSSMKAS